MLSETVKENSENLASLLKVGMAVIKSLCIHSHYCTGMMDIWTPHFHNGSNEDFWPRKLSVESWPDSKLGRASENLLLTLGRFASKATILHYECGWIFLHLVSSNSTLKTTPSHKAPDIWFLKNPFFFFLPFLISFFLSFSTLENDYISMY